MANSNLTTFPVLQTTDPQLNQVQQNIVRTLNPVFNTPLLGGNLLTQQSLNSGANSINHGLGRNLVGWLIVRQRAEANIWDSQDSNSTPGSTLALNASAAVVVDLYCF